MLQLSGAVAPYGPTLAQAGLVTFEDIWQLPRDWVEPPNLRRRGWSGASRLTLAGERPLPLFVKWQENYCYRSLAYPLRGRPTFHREWRNIALLRAAGIPTLDPVYYGERRVQGRYQAVLLTIALDQHQELNALFAGPVDQRLRERVLIEVGDLVRRLHEAGFQHNCLGGNHIMVRHDADHVDLRLLDLEKLKRMYYRAPAAARELARLVRHTPTLPVEDHLRVLGSYMRDWPRRRRIDFVNRVNAHLVRKHQRRGRPQLTRLLPAPL